MIDSDLVKVSKLLFNHIVFECIVLIVIFAVWYWHRVKDFF